MTRISSINNFSNFTGVYCFGFNGIEGEQEIVDWYNAKFRITSAAIGRWISIDPLAQHLLHLSPFNSMANSPIALNDPDGDCPQCWAAFIADAAFDVLEQVLEKLDQGWSIKSAVENIKWMQVGKAGIVGASWAMFTGGVSSYEKVRRMLQDPRVDVLANTLFDTLKDIYMAYDKDGFEGISNFNWGQTLLSNLTANTVAKKMESATKYNSPKTPGAEQKIKTIENKYNKVKGGEINTAVQKNPQYLKAKSDLKQIQKGEKFISESQKELVKGVVKANVKAITASPQPKPESWGPWEEISVTEDGAYIIKERRSKGGMVETKKCPKF